MESQNNLLARPPAKEMAANAKAAWQAAEEARVRKMVAVFEAEITAYENSLTVAITEAAKIGRYCVDHRMPEETWSGLVFKRLTALGYRYRIRPGSPHVDEKLLVQWDE